MAREGEWRGFDGERGRRKRAVVWLVEEDDGEAELATNEQYPSSFFSLLREAMRERGATLQKSYHFTLTATVPHPHDLW